MLGLRVVFGILESGLYPSIVYLLATWYSRCKCTLSRLVRLPDFDVQTMSASDTAFST